MYLISDGLQNRTRLLELHQEFLNNLYDFAKALNNKLQVDVDILDLSKAFDSHV